MSDELNKLREIVLKLPNYELFGVPHVRRSDVLALLREEKAALEQRERELVEALRDLLECVYQADAAEDTVHLKGECIDKARAALLRAALNPTNE